MQFCSAIPSEMKRSGSASANKLQPTEVVISAPMQNDFLISQASLQQPFPKPVFVGLLPCSSYVLHFALCILHFAFFTAQSV